MSLKQIQHTLNELASAQRQIAQMREELNRSRCLVKRKEEELAQIRQELVSVQREASFAQRCLEQEKDQQIASIRGELATSQRLAQGKDAVIAQIREELTSSQRRLQVKEKEITQIRKELAGSRLGDALPKKINNLLTHVVATLVEAKWQKFAVCLGYQANATGQYKEKSDENFIRAMMIIEDWVAKKSGQEATVTALIKACEECDIHQDNIEAAYREKSKS